MSRVQKTEEVSNSALQFMFFIVDSTGIVRIKNNRTFDVSSLEGLIVSRSHFSGFTEKQKQRDKRRFDQANDKEDGLLSRDGLISMFHPEENPNMFGIIVEVRFRCVLCSL